MTANGKAGGNNLAIQSNPAIRNTQSIQNYTLSTEPNFDVLVISIHFNNLQNKTQLL